MAGDFPTILKFYLEFLFKDFPVLFVDSYKEISDLLLLKNNHLFEESMNMNLECLDLDKIFKKLTNLEINHI